MNPSTKYVVRLGAAAALIGAMPLILSAQTVLISGGGNYISGSSFYLGTHSGTPSGLVITYDDVAADGVKLRSNRISSWLWENYDGATVWPSMRLDQSNNLILYNGTNEGVKLNPVSKSLTLGGSSGATLSASGSVLSTSGGLTVAGNFTNTNGNLTGGSNGLNLAAGGTDKSITFTPSGSGNILLNSNDVTISGAAPTVVFKDTDGKTGYWHVNSNIMYLLSGPMGSGYGAWAQVNGRWPLTIDLANNNAAFGGQGVFGPSAPPTDAVLNAGTNNGAYSIALHGAVTGNSAVGAVLDVSNGANWANDILVLRRLTDGGVAPAVSTAANLTFTLDAGSASSHAPQNSGRISSILTATNGVNNSTALTFSTTNVGTMTERMRINNLGYVGFGTNNPTSLLHVYGSAGTASPVIGAGALYLQDSAGSPNNGGSLLFGASQGYWAGIKGLINNGATNTTGDLAFYTRNAATDSTLSERLRIRQNGYVGIGTTSPTAHLQIAASQYASGVSPTFKLANAHSLDALSVDAYTNNTAGSYAGEGVGGGVRILMSPVGGYYGMIGTVNSSRFHIITNGTSRLSVSETGSIGIGTMSPGTYKLAVNGTIRAKEIIVDTGWADYVFEDTYRLAPLTEVEAHIKTKKHLPGIPSAAEVEEHGVSMGDMQSKLLSKIEELTLHLIAQEKRLNEQEGRIHSLEKENAALRAR